MEYITPSIAKYFIILYPREKMWFLSYVKSKALDQFGVYYESYIRIMLHIIQIFQQEGAVDEIVDVILEINESEKISMTIGDEEIQTHELKTTFKKRDSRMIKEVIERLKTYNKPIINIKSFLITVLYNAFPQDYSTGTDPP